jgi:hypothetical protein
MTKLAELIEKVISEIVLTSKEREAVYQAIQLQERFGSSKSVDLLDKYEKIIEGLIK